MNATPEQLVEIANRLLDTSGNFYQVAPIVLARPLTDEEKTDDVLWNAVCEAGDIFKCEGCDTWLPASSRGAGDSDVCMVCEDDY